MRTLYATDASAYREMPVAVAIPKSKADILLLMEFARTHGIGVIPRAAGTSLAGQVVGNGLVIDISKHFTSILEINKDEHYAVVQPGVVRDELNHFVKPYGLFYGPETSTSNRCMIGGMVGNNSCGARSLVYGSAREHLVSVKGFLADGSEVEFGELSKTEFEAKCRGEHVSGELEQRIYQQAAQILGDETNRRLFLENYPKPSVPRRNTGYALDLLADAEPFGGSKKFNFCTLIAGSEGTLFFATEIKVHLSPALKPVAALQCIHFNSVRESLLGNLVALEYAPTSIELMDHYILECTKENIEQRKNRFFVEGDPAAILVVEFLEDTVEEINRKTAALEASLREKGLGYHFPVVTGDATKQVWELRKAGLGLLSNIPGDAKAVAVIEDTAVDVDDLPDFIEEFNEILKQRGLYCVHYAHAATGELHLRPIIDLKTEEGTKLFRTIATDIAELTKKYRGSLSGEHGDGRLRGEFIAYMMGDELYELFREVKRCWDPWNLFNPGKIVDTPPMDTFLRYTPGQETPAFDTVFDFSEQEGIVRAAELCNGSGDCRKTEIAGGTMCPSYMATRNEKDTTRARANILRETLTHHSGAFDHKGIPEVMDLCLSCKGCKSECPSNVDVVKLKAEAMHQYYQANGVPLRSWLIGNITTLNKMMSLAPKLNNGILRSVVGRKISGLLGFTEKRSLPALSAQTFASWFKKHQQSGQYKNGKVYLFNDEFLNYNDAHL
ncbi:MAG: FAD-linked oxidase C-terminal domain-containing protein, partial [Bacteroidota bacterium]